MKYRLFTTFYFICVSALLFGQAYSSSSYSSNNIGLLEQNISMFQQMNGGAKNGFINNENINFSNGAHHSMADNTLFDLGIRTRANIISEAGNTGSNQFTNFLYGGILFPIKDKKWGLSASLQPYSNMSYTNTIAGYAADSIAFENFYSGQGALNVGKLSSSYKINIDSSFFVSLGLDAQYYFGNVKRTKKLTNTGLNFFNIYDEQSDHMQGLGLQTNLLILKNFSKKSFISFGGSFKPKTNINQNTESVSYSYETNFLNPKDTVQFIENSQQSTIPSLLSIGGSYSYRNQLFVSFDYETQTWDASSLTTDASVPTSYQRINAGLLYTLNTKSTTNFKPSIGIGFSQTKQPFLVQGKNLTSNAIHLGMSLPVFGKLKSKTIFNFGTEFGRYNETVGLYQERFVNMYVGIVLSPNIYDKWFRQAKID